MSWPCGLLHLACSRLGVLFKPSINNGAYIAMLANKKTLQSTPRILAVDDNRTLRIVLVSVLEGMGCAVIEAQSGKQALEMMEQFDFDLVLIDCIMPDMDGYEVAKSIRRMENSKKNVAVVALTGSVYHDERERCIASGMDDYLSKPLNQDDLRMMLAKWLKMEESEFLSNDEQKSSASEGEKIVNPGDIFDLQVLNAFLELIGDESEAVLRKHCEVADNYLKTIRESLDKNDFKAMADAAHPLKSSSRQIGAKDVAEVAAKIEQIGRAVEKDYLKLQEAVALAEVYQARVKKAIEPLFSSGK